MKTIPRVLVQNNSLPLAVLISYAKYQEIERRRTRQARFDVVDRIREAYADIPNDEKVAAAGRLATEVREEFRSAAARP